MKEVLSKVENLVSDCYEIMSASENLKDAFDALDKARKKLSLLEYEKFEEVDYIEWIKRCQNEILEIQHKLDNDVELNETLLEDVKNMVME